MYGNLSGQIFSIAGMIIGLAMLTMFLTSGNTSDIISSVGKVFTGSLSTAMGKGG